MILSSIDRLSSRSKGLLAITFDILVATISFPLAIFIRLENFPVDKILHTEAIKAILLICIIKIICTFFYKAHRGIWRFASIGDLILIIKTVTTSTVLSAIAAFLLTRLEGIPRTAFIIDWGLTIALMSSGRFFFRIWREGQRKSRGVKTLIVGAGRSGEQLIRDIMRSENAKIDIIGILDDAPTKMNRTLHGIKVIGGIDSLKFCVEEKRVEQIIIAIPSAHPKLIGKILKEASSAGVKTLVSPGINDIVGGNVQVSKLRPIDIEDLLGRDPVKLDESSISSMINGKTIMVTGGGGSIGSELCRQILRFGPKKLVIFEICEFFIYSTHMKLIEEFPGLEVIPIVGDVREWERVNQVLEEHKPQLIFHAAAYKHVPMMEMNPREAIKTNVFGTKNVAELASKHGVERFILVSTDKAVNPTNVMGSTKRIAEQVCQAIYHRESNKTKFSMVRFGNVLGSAGSVVPRFWEQIKKGGPITVTHPEITRFFMSIPEACQLVLQTGALTNGGEIFVLDMGESIKIVHLAKGMIRLSGNTEDDIEIKFTGLRPGEKLYEELLADKETTLETSHNKIRIARATKPSHNYIDQLENILSSKCVKAAIKTVVPEYIETPN